MSRRRRSCFIRFEWESAMSRAMSEFDHRYNMLIERFASHPEPGFEDGAEQARVWGRAWGCNSDVGRLRVVLMHRPGEEMHVLDRLPRIPELGAYGDPETGAYWRGETIPPVAEQQAQHDALAQALREEGVEIVYLRRAAPGRHKSVYTRDSCIGVRGGAIVTGWVRRSGEGRRRRSPRRLPRSACPSCAPFTAPG
jgi:hypothetical protein